MRPARLCLAGFLAASLGAALPGRAQAPAKAPAKAPSARKPAAPMPGAKPGAPAKAADPKAADAKPGDKAAAKPDDKPAPPPWAGKPLGAVTALAFSPDGKRLAVGTYGQVLVYDVATWQPAIVFRKIVDTARALAFSPDGRTLAIGCGQPGESGVALMLDLRDGVTARKLTAQDDAVEAIAFRKDGKGLLVGADDNKARFYAALPATTSASLDEHNGRVEAVAFSTKPDYLYATGAMDKVVKIWDEKTNHVVVNFDQSEDGITGLAFLPNGTQLVGSSMDGRLYWWGTYFDQKQKVYGGYPYRRVDAHEGGVYTLAQSGDGRRIITGGADNLAKVWDIDSGGQIKALKDATAPIYATALNQDGKMAATGGREGVVRVYDVDGEKLLTTVVPPLLPAPPAPRIAAAKAPAKRAVSAGRPTSRHRQHR